ncbi:hypothetical protein NLJ89_g3282 [Agrocybe chaxingu]|uniref:Uncharacterized protein n=1 Tax=Agrocybe chaxingu TaxID=84603 RepID=A0A9W8MYE3_9AGAR|nr:hypothetical protein NLJ89_g3282 [Agrocybe chaxingu]
MPLFAGIVLSSLDEGSYISIVILAHEDDEYVKTFDTRMGPNLDDTFQEIVSALPESPPYATLSLPSFLSNEEKKMVVASARSAGLEISPRDYQRDNIHTVQARLVERGPYDPRNDLLVEIGPSALGARLVCTAVEEGILDFLEKERDIFTQEAHVSPTDVSPTDVISLLVDPLLSNLREHPTSAGSDIKGIIIIESSPTALIDLLADQLKTKFANQPIEIIKSPPNSLARYAAEISLKRHRSAINARQYGCIFNVAVLRVGIAKSDGFVVSIIPRNHTLPAIAKTAHFTTSEDGQTTATVKIVFGASPKAQDNLTIAQLQLKGLPPRPKGIPRIKVTIDVEHMGKTRIVVKDVTEQDAPTNSVSTELEDINAAVNSITDEYTGEIEPKYLEADTSGAEGFTEAENRWVGQEVQGDLPP